MDVYGVFTCLSLLWLIFKLILKGGGDQQEGSEALRYSGIESLSSPNNNLQLYSSQDSLDSLVEGISHVLVGVINLNFL